MQETGKEKREVEFFRDHCYGCGEFNDHFSVCLNNKELVNPSDMFVTFKINKELKLYFNSLDEFIDNYSLNISYWDRDPISINAHFGRTKAVEVLQAMKDDLDSTVYDLNENSMKIPFKYLFDFANNADISSIRAISILWRMNKGSKIKKITYSWEIYPNISTIIQIPNYLKTWTLEDHKCLRRSVFIPGKPREIYIRSLTQLREMYKENSVTICGKKFIFESKTCDRGAREIYGVSIDDCDVQCEGNILSFNTSFNESNKLLLVILYE